MTFYSKNNIHNILFMSSVNAFIDYCTQILDANFGHRSKRIIEKAKSRKNLNDRSNIGDFEEFINQIELSISVLSGKNNAINICNAIRSKAIEINMSRQAMDIYNALRSETSDLSITEFLRKINVTDVCAFRPKAMEKTERQKPFEISIANKIEEFLVKQILPNEGEIKRYSTYLSYKYCEDVKKVKKDIFEKVKLHVRKALIRRAVREEIKNLLTRYPQPTQTDIDDFAKHIHFSNVNFQEDELRQQIEDEMLYRKFYEYQDIVESPELLQFIDIIKTYNDKNDISREMQIQGILYLIEDESGVSDKLIDEYVELITTNEINI